MQRIVVLVLCLFMVSCSTISTKSETTERNNAESIVAGTFPAEYPIVLHEIKNSSRNKDVDYLEKAIPDIIEGLLNPAKNETAFIDLSHYQPAIPESLDKLVAASNTVFSAYITNIATMSTQYFAILMTNTNEILSGNSNIIQVEITTNSLSTNEVSTNLPYFNKKLYYTFITNEFSGLIDRLSYIPVKINNISRSTNESQMTNQFYMEISGSFKILSKKSGPNSLRITLKIDYINEVTNSKKIVIKCREDKVSEKVARALKDIRQAFLNRPAGDIIIVSDPEDANIYLDGNYIGKSPLYYPAVIEGSHRVVLLKEGYQQGNIKFEVLQNKTNLIRSSINSWESGGEVVIESTPSNAQVFIDSLFRGVTPLSLTNLELNKQHRVKIISDQKELKPFYRNFTLTSKEQKLVLKSQLREYEGSSTTKKKNAWLMTYSSWGLTVGVIGLNIYAHYQKEHYQDLVNAYGGTFYTSQLSSFTALEETSFTVSIISGILSGTVTAYALSTDEIFLGFNLDKDYYPKAILGIRF